MLRILTALAALTISLAGLTGCAYDGDDYDHHHHRTHYRWDGGGRYDRGYYRRYDRGYYLGDYRGYDRGYDCGPRYRRY